MVDVIKAIFEAIDQDDFRPCAYLTHQLSEFLAVGRYQPTTLGDDLQLGLGQWVLKMLVEGYHEVIVVP